MSLVVIFGVMVWVFKEVVSSYGQSMIVIQYSFQLGGQWCPKIQPLFTRAGGFIGGPIMDGSETKWDFIEFRINSYEKS